MDGNNSDERFPPTSGRVLGTLGLVIGLVVAVAVATEGGSWTVAALGVLFAAVSWVALLRPRVAIEDDVLVMRNMVETVRIPLAAVEEVVVRHVLAVRAGEKRYTSPAIARPRRQMRKDDLLGSGGADGSRSGSDGSGAAVADQTLADQAFAVFVEQRIRERARTTRERQGISSDQADPVVRTPAVPEIAVLALSVVALLVAIAL